VNINDTRFCKGFVVDSQVRRRSASLCNLYKTMRPLSLIQGTKLTGNSLFPSHTSNDKPGKIPTPLILTPCY